MGDIYVYIYSWETFYARSLSNLNPGSKDNPEPTNNDNDNDNDSDKDNENDESDDEDPGTSWFKEHNAPQKVVELLTSDEFPLSPATTHTQDQEQEQPSILDLGTGNGSMLALLRRGGFGGKMVGVDYSRGSVELARALHHAGPGPGLRFEEWDILNAEPGDWFPAHGFDLVLDKGTFDAVSLSDEGDGVKRVCERYPRIAAGLVRRGGFLVVTSCNWTEPELKRWFLPASGGAGGATETRGDHDAALQVWGRVEYPVFKFGGMEGQGVCTVCFQRVH